MMSALSEAAQDPTLHYEVGIRGLNINISGLYHGVTPPSSIMLCFQIINN